MRKISASETPLTFSHNQVQRKALIQVGDLQSSIQTLNDAHLRIGQSFEPHAHEDSEEIYYFLGGEGEMEVGREKFKVRTGDCIVVEPGETHGLRNTSSRILRFLTIRALA